MAIDCNQWLLLGAVGCLVLSFFVHKMWMELLITVSCNFLYKKSPQKSSETDFNSQKTSFSRKNCQFFAIRLPFSRLFLYLSDCNRRNPTMHKTICQIKILSIMKEIYDINIQCMNNGAHFTFVSNILTRAEADTAVKGQASELVGNFKAAVAAEDEALKISKKSLLTDEIAKADSDRDALYTGYKKAVEGFLAMPIADMAQAAKILPST
jgi:hypothetical protein